MARDLNRSIKVYIDNSDAMAKSQALEARITKLRGELEKLNQQGKKDTREHKSTEKALGQLERSYGNYQNKIKETERILNNLSGSTYKELQSVRRTLRRELQSETRGTEQYTAKLRAYNQVQKEITFAQKEMNGTLGAQGTLMSRVANGFNKYFGMVTAGLAAITGLSFTLRKLSQDAAAMDDTYADVMKTTNMTKEEVLDLNEAFKRMDTRTSREQLNLLARDAGKLGLQSREDILGFVEAANEIQVALGEDLGEGAVREVGKMVDVFTKSTHELEDLDLKGKMLAVGSAINELGASSSAQEQYLVQFAGRLGGVAAQANIGIDAILGFGSVLDQDMQKVEMSATALQQILIKMMGDPAKFAQIAGVEVGKFTDLVRTDANEAVKVLLRSLNEKGGFAELIPLFDEMGLSGTRAVGVLSSLASSVDKIDEAQQLANESMVEATSLTDEYNIKNTNANAELEKRRKAFKDSAEDLGKRLNPALLKSTNIITYIIKFLPTLLDFFEKYGRYVLYMVTVYAAYTAGIKISIVWETRLKAALTLSNIQLKLKNGLLVAGRIAALAYTAVMSLLTGNITRARAAWRALNAAMATNPIGLIAVAVAAAVAGIIKLVQWLNRTTAATKAVREATKQFNNELASETREANQLFEALKKTNPESDTHLRIRKEIISKYGAYLQGLVDEKGNITDIGEALKAVNNGLREQIALKIRNQAAETIMTDTLDKQADITDKALKRIGKQIDNEHVLSGIRETINRTISEFTSEGSSDYAQLQRDLLSQIQNTYGVDAYKGVFNVKNVVSDLVNEVEKSENALEKVDAKFSGIIDRMTNVQSVIKDMGDDPDPDPTPPPIGRPSDEANKKELEAFELAHKQKMLALKKQQLEENKTEEWFAQESVKIQVKYYEDKITLQKKHGDDTVDTETQQIDFLLNLHKNADDNLLKMLSESRNSMLQSLDGYIELEREKLQDQVDAGTITRHEYNSALIRLELDAAQERVDIAEEYEKMVRDEIFETHEAREKALADAVKDTEKAYSDMARAVDKSNRDTLKEEEEFQKEREALLQKYNLLDARARYDKELAELDAYYQRGLLKEEEYQKSKLKLKMDYYAEYAQNAVDVSQGLSQAVSAYHKLEADSLEAQKQRELKAAGDNAEKREEISQKYAQKELDLKKKQSAANATIQIAEATSAAALAIANIWSKHAANPILAGILTALSAATTALQIASIIKQRSAIMSTTLTPSSGTSSGTGARVVNQRAKGKYDVIGADDGRTYRDVPYAGLAGTGFVSTPTLMGEQGRELVVSAPDLSRLQRHINYPLIINAINDARSGVVPQRADGNYSQIPQQTQPVASLDPRLIAQLTNAIERLNNQGVLASVSLSEIQSKQDLLHKSQKIGSK